MERKSKKTGTPKDSRCEQYLKIPYHILNIETLDLRDKVLLAHIYSFGQKGCWQSNATLAKIFMTSPRTIKRWLAKIILACLVRIESPKGYYRTIWAKSHPDVREAVALYYRGKKIDAQQGQNCPAGRGKTDPVSRPDRVLSPGRNCHATRTHPKTCFVTRLSENFVVKAGGGKGSEACFRHSENLFRRQRRPTEFAANRSRKRFWDEF